LLGRKGGLIRDSIADIESFRTASPGWPDSIGMGGRLPSESMAGLRRNQWPLCVGIRIVFSQGDAADAVFYIQKGKVKLTVVSEQRKEAVVAILSSDDFFGEGCLAGQAQRIATVKTMADSTITRLEKSAILRLLHKEPTFSEMFIAHLLGRSIRVEADLVDQLFNSSEKRLARMLLLLANFGKETKPEPIIAKIVRRLLPR
jgi:CRP/FNR family transcriptional regulator, cyclic AMP receptor protein